MKKYPSQEFLKDLLKYENGMLFYIKNPPRTRLIGTRVGTNGPQNYRIVTINREIFFEHRLIYILLNGPIPDNLVIDHIDRDPSNNNIDNLRAITTTGNALNRSTKTHVQKWTDNKWYARFSLKGKQYSKFLPSEKEAEDWVLDQKNQIINSDCHVKQ